MSSQKYKCFFIIFICIFLIVFFKSCKYDQIDDISYLPVENYDVLKISSPMEQGISEIKIKNVYQNANRIDNIYSLLIIKNGCLISEAYFNDRKINDFSPSASVTKSYISALAGIALREGIIKDLDVKMKTFFPEFDWKLMDSRKSNINIRQILQMRSGYPWEEKTGYMDIYFSTSNWIPFIEKFPLLNDPGTEFGYSNFTAHMMAVIIARAAGINLKDFAEKHLFDPLGVVVKSWPQDIDGYYYGGGDISFTPRDMAKFGLLYLNRGNCEGIQILPERWVEESFKIYSETTYGYEILDSIRNIKYGYLWWSATSGEHQFNFAWGNGGQLICVLKDLNMVIITTAQYLGTQLGEKAWEKHKRILELVGDFIGSL